MGGRDHRAVFVETRARLHFGVLDLLGAGGRWFGGIGAAAPGPRLLVSAAPSEGILVEGEDGERAERFARLVLEHYQIAGGVRVRVHRALPSHAGLGSGTQLALAVGRAVTELNDVVARAPELSMLLGRAGRSAVGTWTFEDGGLVLEGGRRRTGGGVAPLLARLRFPDAWRCVVVVPASLSGISGEAESAALNGLPRPPAREVERVAHLVLVRLLPAVVEDEIDTFGEALTEIQVTTGRWFAEVQGGAFVRGPSSDLVRCMLEWGARGVGQSSWGPAVYGFAQGDEAGARLAERVRAFVGAGGAVYEGPLQAPGVRVWRCAPVGLREAVPFAN